MDTAPTEIYTLSLHDALPIFERDRDRAQHEGPHRPAAMPARRSEEHTSELQSLAYLVCRLLLEKTNRSRSPWPIVRASRTARSSTPPPATPSTWPPARRCAARSGAAGPAATLFFSPFTTPRRTALFPYTTLCR